MKEARVMLRLVSILSLLITVSCSGGPSGPTEPLLNFNDTVIVAFGNSITRGVGDIGYPSSASGYPFRLEQLLQAAFPTTIVLNRGAPGELIEEGERRLPFVLGKDDPDFVLILEGYNDIPIKSSESIARSLESMVQTVASYGAVPIIATLTPTAGPRVLKDEGIEALNLLIREIALRNDILFVDLHAAFRAEPDLELLLDPDGLHPNSDGYQVMAQAWFEEMAPDL